MAEVLVEAVSQYGLKHSESGDKWINFDKNAGLTKDIVHPGDSVELTMNKGGFITAIKVGTAAPPKAKWTGGGKSYVESPEKSAKMARGAAVKAVFESQTVFEMVKDMDEGEALKKMLALAEEVADYIEKGL